MADEGPGRDPTEVGARGPEGEPDSEHSVEASAELRAAQTFPPKRPRHLPSEPRDANPPACEVHGPLPEDHELARERTGGEQEGLPRNRRILQHPDPSDDARESKVSQGIGAYQTLHRLVF